MSRPIPVAVLAATLGLLSAALSAVLTTHAEARAHHVTQHHSHHSRHSVHRLLPPPRAVRRLHRYTGAVRSIQAARECSGNFFTHRTWCHEEQARVSVGADSQVVVVASRYVGQGNPTGTGPREWCADFVNFILKLTGHRPGPDRLAAHEVHAGPRLAGPQVGAIFVLRSQHHTGFVAKVLPTGIIGLSGNSRGRRVALVFYSFHSIASYTAPS